MRSVSGRSYPFARSATEKAFNRFLVSVDRSINHSIAINSKNDCIGRFGYQKIFLRTGSTSPEVEAENYKENSG